MQGAGRVYCFQYVNHIVRVDPKRIQTSDNFR